MLTFNRFQSLDEAYIAILSELIEHGTYSSPRSLPTLEMIGCAFTLSNPRNRYISIPARRWSLAYALGEFSWHTRGSNLTEEISWYAPYWEKVSNNSKTIQGSSYGATIFESQDGMPSQWQRIMNLLKQDRQSRRAVLTFSKQGIDLANNEEDAPCSQSLQFIIRNNTLDAICHMRSNDAVIGLPYDIFFFTMIQEMAANTLDCELGSYHHSVGSLHIYETHKNWASEIINDNPTEKKPMQPMHSLEQISLFHQAESFSRKQGIYFKETNFVEPCYWSELSKAVSFWNLKKHDNISEADSIIINDPLLKKLLLMRPLKFKSSSNIEVKSCNNRF